MPQQGEEFAPTRGRSAPTRGRIAPTRGRILKKHINTDEAITYFPHQLSNLL
jgi:hypothetical protein